MTEEELPGPDFLPSREMTRDELEEQINLWAGAAERAYRAGFDACEFNHGTAHQGNTFLSGYGTSALMNMVPQSFETGQVLRRCREEQETTGQDFASMLYEGCGIQPPRANNPCKRVWELVKCVDEVADSPLTCVARDMGTVRAYSNMTVYSTLPTAGDLQRF
jgi:hypothetical protein